MSEWVPIMIGSGGFLSILIIVFRSGQKIGTLSTNQEEQAKAIEDNQVKTAKAIDRVEKAINGPLTKKFDLVAKAIEDTRKRGEQIRDAWAEKAEMCGRHEASLESLKESAERTADRLEKMQEEGS